jgi:hypothetical protein
MKVDGTQGRNKRRLIKKELTGRRMTDRGVTGFWMAKGKVTDTSYDKKETGEAER